MLPTTREPLLDFFGRDEHRLLELVQQELLLNALTDSKVQRCDAQALGAPSRPRRWVYKCCWEQWLTDSDTNLAAASAQV
jgi:hypothetical protein